MQQSRIFVGMVLILIFGEVLGLYGCVNSSTAGLWSYLTVLVSLLLSSSTPERIEWAFFCFLLGSLLGTENVNYNGARGTIKALLNPVSLVISNHFPKYWDLPGQLGMESQLRLRLYEQVGSHSTRIRSQGMSWGLVDDHAEKVVGWSRLRLRTPDCPIESAPLNL